MTAIKTSYDNDINDEFVLPTIIDGYPGMKDGDGILMANFRADRARQILAALCDPEFDGFKRAKIINFSTCVGMAEYSESHNRYFQTLFPPEVLHNILGQIVAEAGMRQLRIAETEKYAHVTFFLNGGREDVFNGEERILIPSPKVATYDLQPEMSAPELTDKLVQAVKSDAFDLIVVNYANGDMVGHTGILMPLLRRRKQSMCVWAGLRLRFGELAARCWSRQITAIVKPCEMLKAISLIRRIP